jgi:hypothetical protein
MTVKMTVTTFFVREEEGRDSPRKGAVLFSK